MSSNTAPLTNETDILNAALAALACASACRLEDGC